MSLRVLEYRPPMAFSPCTYLYALEHIANRALFFADDVHIISASIAARVPQRDTYSRQCNDVLSSPCPFSALPME